MQSAIEIKTEAELKDLRKAAKIASNVLRCISKKIKPGVSTQELNEEAEKYIRLHHAEPAFLGYRNYPKSICTSINSEVVHGIPSKDKKLKNGDLISIDLGVKYNGLYGDIASTFPVGDISPEASRLLTISMKALNEAIRVAKAYNRVGDISHTIETNVERNGFNVVRDYVGHGIGRELHEEPFIPNFGEPGTGRELLPGMVICIEVMTTEASWRLRILDDNWTAVTVDGGLSAHFEHMVEITELGPRVLTSL